MTIAKKPALNGHVTGEVQMPYLDPQDLYDDKDPTGVVILWGFGVALVAVVAAIIIVLRSV